MRCPHEPLSMWGTTLARTTAYERARGMHSTIKISIVMWSLATHTVRYDACTKAFWANKVRAHAPGHPRHCSVCHRSCHNLLWQNGGRIHVHVSRFANPGSWLLEHPGIIRSFSRWKYLGGRQWWFCQTTWACNSLWWWPPSRYYVSGTRICYLKPCNNYNLPAR